MKVMKNKLKKLLKDKVWRLNNLYKIKDKNGKIINLKLNQAQKYLFENYTYRNIILKARQLGFTTFIDVFFFDDCLFNKNITTGIIAHNLEDANKIFKNKVKFVYENLPDEIKSVVKATTDRAGEMIFSNGSSISVSTSFRSGTLQRLHISELAKISLKYPQKAEEIMTGAVEAVSEDGIIFIESTSEGSGGIFFDIYEKANKISMQNRERHKLEYKDFFYPWYFDEKYKADKSFYMDKFEEIDYKKYFNELESKNIKLTIEQKAWYCLKCNALKEKMKQEYPTTPEEAFSAGISGTYYYDQFNYLRNNKKIGVNCYDKNLPVYTAWDLGYGDSTAIWFIQFNRMDKENPYRAIDYYENSGEGIDHYLNILKSKPYKYIKHIAPHDINNHVWSSTGGVTAWEKARQKGIYFEVAPKVSTIDGINEVRKKLVSFLFDKKTEHGYNMLERYRKEWNDKTGKYKDKPFHDETSHCADAFRYFSVTVNKINKKQSDMIDMF